MERRRTTRKSKTPHGENPGSSPLKHGIRGRPSWIRKARPPAALQKRAEREQKESRREQKRACVRELVCCCWQAGKQESVASGDQGIRAREEDETPVAVAGDFFFLFLLRFLLLSSLLSAPCPRLGMHACAHSAPRSRIPTEGRKIFRKMQWATNT